MLKSRDFIQQEKFNVLFKNHQHKHNPDGAICNYSKISLSDEEKSLLVKGFRFSLPPKKLRSLIMLVILLILNYFL